MNSTLAKLDEFLIVLNCEENEQGEQLLYSDDFTSSEMTTIQNYVSWQGVTNCWIENIGECMEVSINNTPTPTIGNLFYDYNNLDTGDQTIVLDFVNLMISKAIA
jgi:hypothetical protein